MMHRDTKALEDSSRYVTGYFAFPPHTVAPPVLDHPWQTKPEIVPQENLQLVTHAWKDHIRRREITRQKRVDLEREEGLKGDVEWVKSGGILRDKSGKRDIQRTEQIRRELDLRERDQHALERWTSYDRCWNIMLASTAALTYCDIPWPVEHRSSGVQDLTPQAISDFLLRVQNSNGSRRDRIRYLLLRFHPDKTSSFVSRITDGERDIVKDGIQIVFIYLKALQGE